MPGPKMIKRPGVDESSLPLPMPMMAVGQSGGGLMNALMKMLGKVQQPAGPPSLPMPDPRMAAGARDPMFTAVDDASQAVYNAARSPGASADPMDGIYALLMKRFGGG